MPEHVLVVDECQPSDAARMVASFGYIVTTAIDGQDALDKLEFDRYNAILVDLIIPRMGGFVRLKELGSRGEQIPAIILTAAGAVQHAVPIDHDLTAYRFLGKPVQPAALSTPLERAIQQSTLRKAAKGLRQQLSLQSVLGEVVGSSQAMMEVFLSIRQVAATSASVPIRGERGTSNGVTRAIHNLSSRRDGPFVGVNCAALPEPVMEGELPIAPSHAAPSWWRCRRY